MRHYLYLMLDCPLWILILILPDTVLLSYIKYQKATKLVTSITYKVGKRMGKTILRFEDLLFLRFGNRYICNLIFSFCY